jgi:hypothetical protein
LLTLSRSSILNRRFLWWFFLQYFAFFVCIFFVNFIFNLIILISFKLGKYFELAIPNFTYCSCILIICLSQFSRVYSNLSNFNFSYFPPSFACMTVFWATANVELSRNSRQKLNCRMSIVLEARPTNERSSEQIGPKRALIFVLYMRSSVCAEASSLSTPVGHTPFVL